MKFDPTKYERSYRPNFELTQAFWWQQGVFASGHTIHGTVRPHIRRAHWHTFLMGAGREKRILKWLPPTFVKSAELSEG